MSSQASSAGHGEKEVRKKIVETGDVDVILSLRGNFFYTRTVPCELWFFDRARPAERADKVLMLDARGIYRKVTRAIYDFSPEQLRNLSAIVWLYRGQQSRFLGLVGDYLAAIRAESAAIPAKLAAFDGTLADLRARFDRLQEAVENVPEFDGAKKIAIDDANAELLGAATAYATDRDCLLASFGIFRERFGSGHAATNDEQHAARRAFDPHSDAIRGLIKQIDLLYKVAARFAVLASDLATDESTTASYDRRVAGRLVKQLEDQRIAAVEKLKEPSYFHRQVAWLQDRFPCAELRDVPGLVNLVERSDIEAADWSLTPGRYVGVAPIEEDQDFDFEAVIRDIHVELADLNQEAAELAARIQANFEDLGI